MAVADCLTIVYGRIYCITNLLTGKQYIGKTKHSIESRWRRHCRLHEDYLLHRAIAKHGPHNFRVSELATATSSKELNELERAYIVKFGTLHPGGYNLALGGEGGSSQSSTRLKLRKLALARWGNPQFRDRMSELWRRISSAPDARETRRQQAKDAWAKPEHRAAVAMAQALPECRKKMSDACRAAWENPEYREKKLAALKKKYQEPGFLQRRGMAIAAGLARRAQENKR